MGLHGAEFRPIRGNDVAGFFLLLGCAASQKLADLPLGVGEIRLGLFDGALILLVAVLLFGRVTG